MDPFRTADVAGFDPGRCFYCGARRDEASTHCTRCGGAQHVFPCPTCTRPAYSDLGTCRCGFRSEPLRAAEGTSCRRCKGTLTTRRLDEDRVAILECETCKGAFVGAPGWSALLDGVSLGERGALAQLVPAPPERTPDPTTLLKLLRCPACSVEMERLPFAHRTEAVIDMCVLHGLWFDGGELVRVIHVFQRLEAGEPLHVEPEEKPLELWEYTMLAKEAARLEATLEEGKAQYARMMWFPGDRNDYAARVHAVAVSQAESALQSIRARLAKAAKAPITPEK